MTGSGHPQLPEAGVYDGAGRDVPLVELVDRLLETGVCISGDVLVSVAGIDLIQLGLRAVLEGVQGAPAPSIGVSTAEVTAPSTFADVPPVLPSTHSAAGGQGPSRCPSVAPFADGLARRPPRPAATSEVQRIGRDPDDVENGLAQLVLTLVELVRQVLERQAIRRVESDSLSDDEVERLGIALSRLDERMDDLKRHFRFSDEDLSLRLGGLRDVG
jgi:hypothetical protein